MILEELASGRAQGLSLICTVKFVSIFSARLVVVGSRCQGDSGQESWAERSEIWLGVPARGSLVESLPALGLGSDLGSF